MKSIAFYLTHPKDAILGFMRRNGYLFPNDKQYLSLRYWIKYGQWIDWNNPKGFCEKLQWLKVNYRRPEFTGMVDKIEVKKYVSERIGAQYVIKTLGEWDKFEDIDFSQIKTPFVLKSNNGSGGDGVYICKDSKDIDINKAKNMIEKSLNKNVYQELREWPYLNIKRIIFAEQYLEDESGQLKDYKVMCFNGEPKLIQVHIGRYNGVHTQDFYDTQWRKLNLNQIGCVCSDIITPKPECLDEMIQLSRILSKDLPHVRVDWYIVEGKLYFGELTFYDASGFEQFIPQEKELELGSWITLPKPFV